MFVNLTPHAINLPGLQIEPSGQVARCQEISSPAGTIGHVSLIRKGYGAVIDLPEPQEGVIYIVSAMVRLAVPHRTDVASPGDLLRDEAGKVIGAANLAVN